MSRFEDTVTLKLQTLRRLVAGAPSHLIFDVRTNLGEIEGALLATPRAVAVIVDDAGVLQGTLRLQDLPGHDRSLAANAVMARDLLQAVPEQDPESALQVMRAHDVDRVLVVEANGTLLGV